MDADHRNVAVPEHTILSRLGRGGMASVYLAREERLGRLVAVKVIDERFDKDVHFRKRFEREARTAAGLTHPHIVPIYHYGFTADDRPFISMAFLDGGSLRDRLNRRGTLPVDEALAITRQLAGALHVAHARNIIHRDLKPDNVLFQGETALLTDFGIAKVLDASTELTTAGANPGTVKYSSPEQAQEKPIDQRSDIYALGVVLYEMLTGRTPIEADTVLALMMRIAHDPPTPLPPPLKGLQPFLDVLLTKDPAERIGSCIDMVSIIQAMERNWARYGSIDRLTDGVAMMPSQRQAAEVNQDDDTMVYGRQAARAAQHGADEQRAPTAARTISSTASATIASTVAQEAAFDFTTTDPPLPTAVRGSNVPGFGLLTLLMQPGNALVLLDYLDSGKLDRREVWTGKPLRLPAGRVSVHASAPGYEDLRTCIDLSATDMQIALSLSAATSNLSTSNASTSNAFTSASLAAMSTAIGMTQPYANAQPLLSSAPTHAAFSIAALPGGKWTVAIALVVLAGLTIPLWRSWLAPSVSTTAPTTSSAAPPETSPPATSPPATSPSTTSPSTTSPPVASQTTLPSAPTSSPQAGIAASAPATQEVARAVQETTDQSDAAPAAELQRNALLTQLTGKWTFDNCGAAAMFSIQGDTLFQSWPDVGPAAEQIVGTTGDVVETRVIAPVKQRGQLFRYHPSATRLVVDDVRHGRSGTLQRCP